MFSRMNGWQRIWFVLTVLVWIGFAVVYPAYVTAQSASRAERTFGPSIRAEYESGKCKPFINEPIATLIEPDTNSPAPNCWHIYTSRTVDSSQGLPATPYTIEQFGANNRAKAWEVFRTGFDPISILVVLGSAMVYSVGWLISWIRRGF